MDGLKSEEEPTVITGPVRDTAGSPTNRKLTQVVGEEESIGRGQKSLITIDVTILEIPLVRCGIDILIPLTSFKSVFFTSDWEPNRSKK